LLKPVGDHAVLLELPHNASVHTVADSIRRRYGDQLQEVVPGDRTVLVVWLDRRHFAGALMSELKAVASSASAFNSGMRASGISTIRVRYDGGDLDAVAATLGISREAVVEVHSGVEYTVAFVGFSPGFPYLVAAEPSQLLELPRLATPRTEVPAGSVAVAAGYCGIYPRASPGGWNLLGRTDVVLFDPERERPALLEPGMPVRFEAI
jgi:KipI family sensor histidine kinase inhibitor